jgi:hypothetical protein
MRKLSVYVETSVWSHAFAEDAPHLRQETERFLDLSLLRRWMMSFSKAMQEVWRWKEEVAREIEGMSSQERIAYFQQAELRLAEKTGGKKLNLPRAAQRRK